jgi:type I restriction enzyme R subunit
MNESQPGLDEKFKDTEDPLRLVFVCAMWLTGFDAPSCSTVYLDKPMRNHTLMQTIARANRVFPGKHSGVIVDYANVFASLEKALAIYGAGKGGKNPVKDKQQLVEELRKAVVDATAFCAAHGVMLAEIEATPAGSMERLSRIEDGMNALISPDPLRRDFFAHERLVSTLYRAVKPDPSALEFASRVACLTTLAEAIRAKLNPNPPDISQVMGQINGLLDESITGHEIRESGATGARPVEDQLRGAGATLQGIEAQEHRPRSAQGRHPRPTGKDDPVEPHPRRLRRKVRGADRKLQRRQPQHRGAVRGAGEAVQQPERRAGTACAREHERGRAGHLRHPDAAGAGTVAEERAEVKKAARELLARLKALLVLNWRQKSAARSQLKLTIEDTLDCGLPRAYTRRSSTTRNARRCSSMCMRATRSGMRGCIRR